ncbi:MAG: nicotinate-nucleotide adenylyltransferase [Pelotomaculaceae bacterium]|jgi:nicotinate-nucleotide adenylyltransferase|uniref:Putative nicotinate-nucleotide adenylyltransferase n=1 Tax=anaerobic digester metagenome TaxID=1263854 RepID=A0A485M3K1_9ZZZZ|nr:nicotinate-nucleotide adenylyltransferase [Bacillota bacterium]HHU86213.1 nicotinate-nucleotide adenylyltransferase [Peptococcaceae bacterium]
MSKEADSKCRRLGIMGGTFDPIHYGHLVAAEGARYEFNLEKVIFVPAGRPPHKPNYKITDPWKRFAMTRLAVQSNPFFQVLPLEVERPGPSYAIDTVQEIALLNPGMQVYFITGADAVSEILTWRNTEQLLSICRFIAATRPGYRMDDMWEKLNRLPVELKDNIFCMEVPALAISSSDIRQRLREGRPVKYLLPELVEEYIAKNNIYGH